MTLPTIFDLCVPRKDVLEGKISEADFAADLAQVMRNEAAPQYRDPELFFSYTYPTKGLKELLKNVVWRLAGDSRQVSSIFRLHTNYGGGKTHSIIALVHALKSGSTISSIREFLDPAWLPKENVKIAVFEGENSDPMSGHTLGDGLRAYTPWGEIAYALGGKTGYERVRAGDETGTPPGADTIREFIGDQPCLILIDELSIYLRRAEKKWQDAGMSLASFLSTLFKAVESSPKAALVFTLALGKDGKATDAYTKENEALASFLIEAESIIARKATLIDPTEEDETVRVLRRRLFERIEDEKAKEVVEAYKAVWDRYRDNLPRMKSVDNRIELFRLGYPLHPELMEVLTGKLSTLGTFQRVRGMLRILARTVMDVWQEKRQDTYAIHLFHINPGNESIRNELIVRLNQEKLVPALKSDVASMDKANPSWAESTDKEYYSGLKSYAAMVARTVFLHTLSFNPQLQGCSQQEVRYSLAAPDVDIGFVDDAVRRFVENSAYRDDKPNANLKFLYDANLTMLIKHEERNVDPEETRALLNDKIKEIFKGNNFELIPFPVAPTDVPDDPSGGKPLLVLLSYDACDVGTSRKLLPDLVRMLWQFKGSNKDLRINRNNLVFIVVDHDKKEDMRRRIIRRLALEAMIHPSRMGQLPEHQQDKVRELYKKSDSEAATMIQQAYRHLFYPDSKWIEEGVNLTHATLDIPNTSADPGAGQKQVERYLRDVNKLRLPGDQPDSPLYIKDHTPLKKGWITTASLRQEFYRDPSLTMLVGNDVFLKLIRNGIEQRIYVYKSGDLVWGPGDPAAQVKTDEESFIYSVEYAASEEIWPRLVKETPVTQERPEVVNKPAPPPESADSCIRVDAKPLRECFTLLWEQVGVKKLTALSSIILRIYNIDGFKMMSQAAIIKDVEIKMDIKGMYKTSSGGVFSYSFLGTLQEAGIIKDFLTDQMRASLEKSITITYLLKFNGTGFNPTYEAVKDLTDTLTRLGMGAVLANLEAEGRR